MIVGFLVGTFSLLLVLQGFLLGFSLQRCEEGSEKIVNLFQRGQIRTSSNVDPQDPLLPGISHNLHK